MHMLRLDFNIKFLMFDKIVVRHQSHNLLYVDFDLHICNFKFCISIIILSFVFPLSFSFFN